MKSLFLTIIALHIFSTIPAQEFSEWRGKGRTGIYNETGLLKKWPENGPVMLWFNDSLPTGYSSPAIANNKIYLTGLVDTMEVLLALDVKGNVLWQTVFGKAWTRNFSDSRATPTVEKNRVFVSSGTGIIACLDTENGKTIWSVDAVKEYGCKPPKFGMSESVLVDKKNAFYTPGGDETTMIALNKKTGKLIWKSESLKDKPSYASPLIIEKKGEKQILQVSTNYIFGVQPEDGKIVWKYDFGQHKARRNNNTNTPLYDDGGIYVTSGYDHKSVKLQLSEKLDSVSLSWIDTVLDTHHGGVIKLGDYIYGSNWLHNRMGNWVCLDWKTGKVQFETEWRNKGSIIYADGMFYCYEEKNGHVALVKADPKEFKVISEFKVEKGEGPYWAHPVISNGILYIRHAKALMAFDIKEK